MKKIEFVLMLSSVLPGVANSQVTTQTLCFESETRTKIELTIRKYRDDSITKEVGAVAKYGKSKETIPLVFVDDSTADESIDYELRWLEVVHEKLSGQYRLIKPKGATIYGAYVKYKSFRTNKETLFGPSDKNYDECLLTIEKPPVK